MTAPELAIGKQALETGPDWQERQVEPLKAGEHPTRTRCQSQRAQQWHRLPHRRKGGSARQDVSALVGMEALQQFGTVDRTRCGRCVRNFDEIDRAVPIEQPHERDLTPVKRTSPIVPDSKFGHSANLCAPCCSASLVVAPDFDFLISLVLSLTSLASFAGNVTHPFSGCCSAGLAGTN